MKDTQTSAKSTSGKASKGFTDEERATMRERAHELKAAARRGPRTAKADGESDVRAKIAAMPEPDRALAERLHAIITASAPALSPRTWYGMPAYAKDGTVVCFFQSAPKFNTRYATLGFSDTAHLDDGTLWPTAFALKELTAADEARIGAREESGEMRTKRRAWQARHCAVCRPRPSGAASSRPAHVPSHLQDTTLADGFGRQFQETYAVTLY